MQMKFIVYRAEKATRKNLRNSDTCLGYQKIPNSKLDMHFHKTEVEITNEEGEAVVEKGNIQVYVDEKRLLVFAETTDMSDDVHNTLFDGLEVVGELEIPGEKQPNEKFVKKMLLMIRSFKVKKAEPSETTEEVVEQEA